MLFRSLTLVVTGCVAQQEGNNLLRRVPELDLIMGPQHVNQLQDLLEQVFAGNQVVATEPIQIVEDITKPRRDSRVEPVPDGGWRRWSQPAIGGDFDAGGGLSLLADFWGLLRELTDQPLFPKDCGSGTGMWMKSG